VADRKTTKAADDQAAVLPKIAAWPKPYGAVGERIHQIILDHVPGLRPNLWASPATPRAVQGCASSPSTTGTCRSG
jgi:hypothetical protein